jgi:hypothetical protein
MTVLNEVDKFLWDDRQIQDDGTGVEVEINEPEVDLPITQPFDPKLVRVEPQPMTIDLLIKRMKADEIDLAPGFQRRSGIWGSTAKSRLIESLLIRIPLPAFYLDATDEEKWIVVDGLQRLTTLKEFIIDKKLRLSNLEFLTEYNGKRYDDLPRNFQRRIDEAQVTVYLIKEGSSAEVKFTLFKRINTGGLPLSAQEIRHAIYQGKAVKLLTSLSSSTEFKQATDNSIRDDRMADHELVLRFLAFTMNPPTSYNNADLDKFLNDTMNSINHMPDIQIKDIERRFLRAMDAAYKVFGKHAFRKRHQYQTSRPPISKALFETWSVNLDKLNDEQLETLIKRKDTVNQKYINLIEGDEDFNSSITYATASPHKVGYRFKKIKDLISEVLYTRLNKHARLIKQDGKSIP